MPAFDDSVFWVIAAAMTAVALAFVLLPLLARRNPSAISGNAAPIVAIYRGNLAELERERDAGRLSDREYVQAREEIERRLLGDAVETHEAAPTRSAPRSAPIAVMLAIPALAFGLYALFGEPDALRRAAIVDSTLSDTMSASISRDDLAAHLAHNPRDGRGWVLLARIDFASDRFSVAAESYRRALAASPKIAADAGVWCEYADALGMAQGGVLAGMPREQVMRALAIDPVHPKALEMAGSAAFEQGEFASAARYWRALRARLPDGSIEHRELSAAIARVDALASTAAGGDRTR